MDDKKGCIWAGGASPGPWVIRDMRDGREAEPKEAIEIVSFRVPAAEAKPEDCRCVARIDKRVSGGKLDSNDERNAMLIAAAPLLYDELERLRELFLQNKLGGLAQEVTDLFALVWDGRGFAKNRSAGRGGDERPDGAALTGYFDGASRGNPGPAGAGALLVDGSGTAVWKKAEYLGYKTNNEAEYAAAILLLQEAARRGVKKLTVRGDSQLAVNQLAGKWKISKPHLKELARQAWDAAAGIEVVFEWVPREQNSKADALSNIAIDGRLDVGEERGI